MNTLGPRVNSFEESYRGSLDLLLLKKYGRDERI